MRAGGHSFPAARGAARAGMEYRLNYGRRIRREQAAGGGYRKRPATVSGIDDRPAFLLTVIPAAASDRPAGPPTPVTDGSQDAGGSQGAVAASRAPAAPGFVAVPAAPRLSTQTRSFPVIRGPRISLSGMPGKQSCLRWGWSEAHC